MCLTPYYKEENGEMTHPNLFVANSFLKQFKLRASSELLPVFNQRSLLITTSQSITKRIKDGLSPRPKAHTFLGSGLVTLTKVHMCYISVHLVSSTVLASQKAVSKCFLSA